MKNVLIMNNLISNMQKFAYGALFAVLLVSCGDDSNEKNGEYLSEPLQFRLQSSAFSEDTDWADWADKRMAVSINAKVGEYVIGQDGVLTSSEPFYTEQRSLVVEGWFPYRKRKPYQAIVKANQHQTGDYVASNLLEMLPTEVVVDNETPEVLLTLYRRTAKLECVLIKDEHSDVPLDFSQASVSLLNLSGVEIGTTIHTNHQHRAYVFPQVLKAGKDLILVSLPGQPVVSKGLDEDFELKAGQAYQLKFILGQEYQDLKIEISKLPAWDGSDEIISGESPALPEGEAEGDSWEGDSSESGGGSSSTDSSGSSGQDWEGDSSESSGGSSSTDSSGSGGQDWEGDSSESSGSSSSTDSSGSGGGSWEGDSSESSGGSSSTDSSGSGGQGWEGDSTEISGSKTNNK